MLQLVQKILTDGKFDYLTHEATEQDPQEKLIVFLGFDNKNREQTLHITLQEQILNPNQMDSNKYFRIQFQFLFPYVAVDSAIPQLGSLLLFLNQILDFPGLELNELENQIFYRYVWLVKSNGVDSELVLSIIGIILLILELFNSTIERIADGSATFNELLEEIVELTQNIK